MNTIHNWANRPKTYKVGQMWYCDIISETVVITDVINKNIVRCSILTGAVHLNDGNDVKIVPNTAYLKARFGLPRIIFRLTDGPVLASDLTFYKGMMPKKLVLSMKTSLKIRPVLNPVQEKFSAKFLEKLQPLREKVNLFQESIPATRVLRKLEKMWKKED